jgi:hypothetical protein
MGKNRICENKTTYNFIQVKCHWGSNQLCSCQWRIADESCQWVYKLLPIVLSAAILCVAYFVYHYFEEKRESFSVLLLLGWEEE